MLIWKNTNLDLDKIYTLISSVTEIYESYMSLDLFFMVSRVW